METHHMQQPGDPPNLYEMLTRRKRRMVDVQEAAEHIGVCAGMMRKLTHPNGPIPRFKIGRSVRYDPADLDAYLDSVKLSGQAVSHG
jgi:hypothetical protein